MIDLARRHALVAALASRRRKRSAGARFGKPVKPPRALIVSYAQAIVALLTPLDARIRVLADKWAPAIAAASPMRRDSVAADNVARLMQEIEAFEKEHLREPALVAAAARAGSEVSAQNAKSLREALARIVGIDVPLSDSRVAEQIALFARLNASLIKSLGRRNVERVRAVVQAQAGRGANATDIRDAVIEATGATKVQATLIARDQVLKLNGQITELRHRDLGIERYKWSGSLDERERDDHRALEGQVFRYADPPITNVKQGWRNNPGQDINCRCVALPDLSDILGLDE